MHEQIYRHIGFSVLASSGCYRRTLATQAFGYIRTFHHREDMTL